MDEINQQVAHRLRSLRLASGLSLQDLAARSGVSRAMLSQIETLKTNPTIAVLWKVAEGLGVPFAELIDATAPPAVRVSRLADARFLYSADRAFLSRPLLAQVPGHKVELYELELTPGAIEQADPHPPGTHEQVVVSSGRLSLVIGPDSYELGPRDAVFFRADIAHAYRALGTKPFRGLSLILYGA